MFYFYGSSELKWILKSVFHTIDKGSFLNVFPGTMIFIVPQNSMKRREYKISNQGMDSWVKREFKTSRH